VDSGAHAGGTSLTAAQAIGQMSPVFVEVFQWDFIRTWWFFMGMKRAKMVT